MSTTTIPDFLTSVTAAGESAQRADRHKLADLVAELAAGRRPSLDAAAVADLLRRLNLTPEVLEELTHVRQRLDALREQAGREPEARAHLREATAAHTREMEEIKVAESALRARREVAEGELRRARAEVEGVQAAARQAADAIEEFLNLLHPGLAHDARTAASGCKIATGRITELRRRIGEDEEALRHVADDADARPEQRANRIGALEDSLTRLRRELAEVEAAHERAKLEHEALAREAALLVGEECTR